MAQVADGGYAFPFVAKFEAGSFDPIQGKQLPLEQSWQYVFHGMMLRDYIATHALPSVLPHYSSNDEGYRRAAVGAYAIADAMLAARTPTP